ncbi:MAG: group III truncated hemoglobin [Alphaproteobacteria bacterium]|nr:group III truncated hemoglobin [Alphaproteobacteria bacterium]
MGKRKDIANDIIERTGIDEALIDRLVRCFYNEVRRDPLLGPVFNARITDWEPHLQQMIAFWSSVALLSGRYHGRPMDKHLPLPIEGRHFERWLSLFEQTAEDVCSGPAAAFFIERAHRIAESLQLGIARHHGVLLRKGERLELSPAG